MLSEVLLVRRNCRLSVLAANRVFEPILGLGVVGGSSRSSRRSHTDMVSWAAGFAPDKALVTGVRSERAAARLSPVRRLSIILARLGADVRRHTHVIARPAGFAPNESFRAGVWPKVADRES
jgi:hypothetical protein